MDNTTLTKICTKRSCKSTLPISDKFSQCQPCRNRVREGVQASRARKKEHQIAGPSEEQENLENRPVKRRREENRVIIQDEVDHELEDRDAITHSDIEEVLGALRAQFKAKNRVIFHSRCPMTCPPGISPKERVHMIAAEIWKVTGYRFTVKDNIPLKTGFTTYLWCCQDEDHMKQSKPSQDPSVKHRDYVPMERYPCQSRLSIKYREPKGSNPYLAINLEHHLKHPKYIDVGMPAEATDLIAQQVTWMTPSSMVAKIRADWPQVSAAQVYNAWRNKSELYWRRDDCQISSAKKLLQEFGEEVDLFKPEGVPEGVEILAWGMRRIAEPLKGKVVEIGMDATYNTNSKHLELYSIMAEYDNAGFPLTYCLLSSANAIESRKRMTALASWARCVQACYQINPTFAHVDKDMAEIGCIQQVWDVKINLCWWHLRRAVRTRLAKLKLPTTPYNAKRAQREFDFIDTSFIPLGTKVDVEDYEGGIPDEHIPILDVPQQVLPQPKSSLLGDLTNIHPLRIKLPRPSVQAMPTLQEPKSSQPESRTESDQTSSMMDAGTNDVKSQRAFCPVTYRESIVDMMERHYCAHPMIPGYTAPRAESIKYWAVHQIYKFCVQHDLREVWAYLWENWYRKGRWELWARSVHDMIPVLKTTMILESHWRRIKHDFLHHFHLPRCDLLAWILVTKLAPSYYTKLDRLLVQTGRHREPSSWRKEFKKEWLKLENRKITTPISDAYRPNATKWVCTCPAFVVSRFLICKHLVQLVHKPPPLFFLEVKRYRTAPFWRHKDLKPLEDGTEPKDAASQLTCAMAMVHVDDGCDSDDGYDDDAVDLDDLGVMGDDGQTFEEAFNEELDLATEFLKGLRFQLQFRDPRMLSALKREGAGFLRAARACLEKERRFKSLRGGKVPSTWEESTATAMFFRPRTGTEIN